MKPPRLLLALTLVALAGCATLPAHAPEPPVHALRDVADTRLAQVAAAALPPGAQALSGFRLLPEGETAFNARIALARRAGKSIDAQYYLIQNDDLGQQFLRELRDAARRGVRVRLLVDDLYAAGEDDLLSGLAAYTNVDVRIFNPLPARAGPFYFIPGERGMAIIRAVGATQENGRLALVTNSLGLTDEPLVYAGYARYRVDLLKAGVRIYEIGATLGHDSDRLGHFGASIGRLHAKVATIDRRWLFIGSMNLDPRSAQENTEIGLAIDSPDLAETILMLFQEGLDATYRLRLSADGEHVEWLETDAEGWQHVHTREPDEDALLRLKIWLLAPFVGEGLL